MNGTINIKYSDRRLCAEASTCYYHLPQYLLSFITFLFVGARGGAFGWGTALQVERSRVRFPMVLLEFSIDTILGSGSTQSLPGILLDDKGGRCMVVTPLPPSCADCLEIWEPQPPGNLRDCRGLFRGCFTFLICSSNVLFKLSHLTCMNCH